MAVNFIPLYRLKKYLDELERYSSLATCHDLLIMAFLQLICWARKRIFSDGQGFKTRGESS
jgi:hypothetical protein